MDTVMFHTGKELPSFLECTFSQFRLFNPHNRVYFLTDRKHRYNILFDKYGIISMDKNMFYSDKISRFESLFNYGRDDFWTVTATRMIYIENFMQYMGLTDVYHFENDVLVYYDMEDHHEVFKTLYDSLAMTIGGEIVAMTGFMFIKYPEVLATMTQFFIDLLSVYGISGIINKYHIPMVNEMFLMRQYGLEYPQGLRCLPTMPFGEFSENYSIFNSIFDPASYGQFVGGTRSEGPGAKPQDHYIGRWLKANPNHYVIWEKDKDRKVPYLKYNDNEVKIEVKINNLHIHSKNLDKYMSL